MGCAERPWYGLFSHPKKECVVPHSLPWLFHFIIISSWTSLSCCSIWVEKWVLLFWQVIETNIWLKTLMFLTPPPPFPIGLYCFTSQPWRRMSFIIDDSSPNPPFNACTLKPITFPAGALRVWPMLTSTPMLTSIQFCPPASTLSEPEPCWFIPFTLLLQVAQARWSHCFHWWEDACDQLCRGGWGRGAEVMLIGTGWLHFSVQAWRVKSAPRVWMWN